MISLASWHFSSAVSVSSRSRGLSSTRSMGRSSGTESSLSGNGQGEGKRGPLVHLAFGADLSGMPFDDSPHQGKPDARAFEVLDALQALENPEKLSVVGHVETDAIVGDG